MPDYRPRLVDSQLELELEALGATLLIGPKWCGKTTTALQQAQSVLYMQEPGQMQSNIRLAEIEPLRLLEGETPRLLDEWQVAPSLWDAVRHEVDRRQEPGQFILTGSAEIPLDKVMHPGTGRISRIRMSTMTLFESGDSTGEVRLGDLLEGAADTNFRSDLTLESYARILVRGGWPRSIGMRDEVAARQVAAYCESLIEREIDTVDGRIRDEARMRAVLRAYSRHIGTQARISTMVKDLEGRDEGMHANTLSSYLATLRSLCVIDELEPWGPRLRSAAVLRKANTRHLFDPAVAAYFLGATAGGLVYDLETFGFLFESLAVRDVRAYASHLGAGIGHYRDSNDLEVDMLVHFRDGRWGALEVKIGGSEIDKAAKNLVKLAGLTDIERSQPPSFLAIITATEHAYRREDGVYVIPLALLGP